MWFSSPSAKPVAFTWFTIHGLAPSSWQPSAWSSLVLHIVLLDSDCVPVTLFEVEDLWREAQRLQHSGFSARFPPAVGLGD